MKMAKEKKPKKPGKLARAKAAIHKEVMRQKKEAYY